MIVNEKRLPGMSRQLTYNNYLINYVRITIGFYQRFAKVGRFTSCFPLFSACRIHTPNQVISKKYYFQYLTVCSTFLIGGITRKLLVSRPRFNAPCYAKQV